MKRLLLFVALTLFASVPHSLLEIEAKLYPRIMLLEKPIPLVSNTLLIHIIYDPEHKQTALQFAKLLSKQKLPYELVVRTLPHPTDQIPSAYILIHSDPKKIYAKLIHKKRPIFCLYPKDIEWCTHSLAIETKVVPLLNPKLIKQLQLRYDPILYEVGKFYEK